MHSKKTMRKQQSFKGNCPSGFLVQAGLWPGWTPANTPIRRLYGVDFRRGIFEKIWRLPSTVGKVRFPLSQSKNTSFIIVFCEKTPRNFSGRLLCKGKNVLPCRRNPCSVCVASIFLSGDSSIVCERHFCVQVLTRFRAFQPYSVNK